MVSGQGVFSRFQRTADSGMKDRRELLAEKAPGLRKLGKTVADFALSHKFPANSRHDETG